MTEEVSESLDDSSGATSGGFAFPAARRVLAPFFYFIGFLDDLYLYKFHDRTYGETATNLFQEVTTVEESKWSFVSYKSVLAYFGVDSQAFDDFIGYQDAYTSHLYATNFHPAASEPEGLISNSQNFFVVALPLTFLAFLILKGLFYLLFNIRISAVLRKFDFSLLLFLLLFDGNIEQFAFQMTA